MDFEDHPLPDFASGKNPNRQAVKGAQLFTRDSKRTGNACIVSLSQHPKLGTLFLIRTDKGNEFKHTIRELEAQYEIGPYIIADWEIQARKIVLKTCLGCPHRDHKGAFGNPACVPVCRLKNTELPYTTRTGDNGKIHALPTYELPGWCPLDYN